MCRPAKNPIGLDHDVDRLDERAASGFGIPPRATSTDRESSRRRRLRGLLNERSARDRRHAPRSFYIARADFFVDAEKRTVTLSTCGRYFKMSAHDVK
jgi:hypothetical protein